MEPQGGDINHLSCKSKVMGLILHSSCQMRPLYPSSYDLSSWWDIEQELIYFPNSPTLNFFDFGPAWVGPCTVKPVLSGHSKRRPKLVFKTNRSSLNAGQKYFRMLQGEHSAIISTFIMLPFAIKAILSIFELPFKTRFTVQ